MPFVQDTQDLTSLPNVKPTYQKSQTYLISTHIPQTGSWMNDKGQMSPLRAQWLSAVVCLLKDKSTRVQIQTSHRV